MRGEDNDARWVRAGLIEGMLKADVIRERARTVHNAQASEMKRLQTLLTEIEQAIAGAAASSGAV